MQSVWCNAEVVCACVYMCLHVVYACVYMPEMVIQNLLVYSLSYQVWESENSSLDKGKLGAQPWQCWKGVMGRVVT